MSERYIRLVYYKGTVNKFENCFPKFEEPIQKFEEPFNI